MTKQILSKLNLNQVSPIEAVKEFQALSPNNRVYKSKSYEDRVAHYQKAKNVREDILRNKVPFIVPSFLPHFYLSQGLIVVGAESGKSKSTTCSNVLAGFLKSHSDKRAIVISNEEATDAILERTACILLKSSYTDFYHGNMAYEDTVMVKQTVMEIMQRVEVVEGETWDTAYIEDVKAVLESAARDGVSLVLIDYLQTITMSRLDPDAESFQISKMLGFYLKDYGKKYGVPVVTFVQLKNASEAASMADRVQNDKTFYNHGFICMEIRPNFETLTTEFIVHKDRFGPNTGKKVVLNYIGGRLEMEESL